MNYKYQPNKAQLRAIEVPVSGALRLISGPGSGKTFVQEHRYAFLVESDVNPDGILAVVFNRRNADEFKDRVMALCPSIRGTEAEKWITSIHAACFGIFRAECGDAFPGSDKYQVIEHEAQWFKYEKFSIKSFIQTLAEDLWPNPDARPGWKEVWAWIETSKKHGLPPADTGDFFDTALGTYHGEKVYQIYTKLWARMKALKLLTFGDMLLLVDVQLQRDSTFRARWQAKFSHVLVDEAQDVSEQAMRILATLAAPQNNFFAVGDQDQLLYRFTGATPEANLMGGFEDRYPDGATVMMGVNYRSDNTIVIDNAKKLIAYNYADLGGPYEQRYMKDLEPKPGAEPGMEFTFTAYPTPEAEAEGLADTLAALLAPGDQDGFEVQGTEPGQVFVGARTRAQLGYLEGSLLRREVPFINIAGGSFWESKEVADVIGYLRLAHNASDNEAFARVFNIGSNWMTIPWKKSPHYGEYCNHRFLGAAFLRDCRESWDGMARAVQGSDGWRYRAGADDLESFVYELQNRLDEGPAEAVQFILDNCYTKWLKTDEGLLAEDEAENGKVENLKTVVEIARQYATIGEFLAYVQECVKAAEAARQGDWDEFVILSTIHRLKGLERDVVFGIGWGEGQVETKAGLEPRGLLPHTFSLMPPPQFGILPGAGMGRVEDERCLAFVLVTRARQEVHLSYPQEYRGAEFGPSRFAIEMGLAELPIEESDLADELFAGLFGCPNCGDPSSITTVEEGGDFKCRECGHEWNPLGIEPDGPIRFDEVYPTQEALDEQEAKIVELTDTLPTTDMLVQFPADGRFEDSIYRPSARELCEALPDYEPTIQNDQLVLLKEVAPGAVVHVWTSIQVGQIAGGVGDDSIRVTRQDDNKFWFKTNANWIARTVPQDADTPEKAAAHLAEKIRQNVAGMTGTCPKCGAVTVKCNMSIPGRYWWKCAQRCRS